MGPLAVVFGATLPTKNPSSSIRSSTRELAVKHSLRAEPIFPFIFVSPAASLIPLFLSGCFYCFLAFLPNLRRSPAWPLLAPSVLTRRSLEKFPSIFPFRTEEQCVLRVIIGFRTVPARGCVRLAYPVQVCDETSMSR
jgi:hypothetical protein